MTDSLPLEDDNVSNAFAEAAAAAASQSAQGDSAVPSAQSQEPELSAAFRAAQAAGYDVSGYKTDEELVQSMYGQLSQYKPYVDYANQVLPYDKDLREMIAQRSQPAKPAPAAEQAEEWAPDKHFRKAWGQPDYDKGWEAFVNSGMVTIDAETGQFVASQKYANAVPVNVLQGLNSRRTWQRQALERLLENPFEETWKAFQEPLDRYIKDKISSHFQQHDSVQAVNSWESANARVLYEHDAQGNVAYDVYGNMKPTLYGEAFIQAARDARERFKGIGSEDVIRYASAVAQQYLPAPQAAASQEPEAAAPQGKEPSFLKKAMQKASHSANSGGYSEASDLEPVVLESRELENMFTAAVKKAGLK